MGVLRVAGDDNMQRESRRRAEVLGRTARLVRRHGWLALSPPTARMPIDNVEGFGRPTALTSTRWRKDCSAPSGSTWKSF